MSCLFPESGLRTPLGVKVWIGVLIVGLAGCQSSPTSPASAPTKYDQLVQRAVVQAEARSDTSFFWLSNTEDTQARTLMLDLGLDYLRYDREADVLCVWAGEGLQPAVGYATAPSSGDRPVDAIGTRCNIEGTCAVDSVSEEWSRFQCE